MDLIVTDTNRWFVYFLWAQADDDKLMTYIGYTNDLHKRWRRHNRYIGNGAMRTTIRASASVIWHPVCVMSGFPDKQAAMKFEAGHKVKQQQKRRTREHDKALLANVEFADAINTVTKRVIEWIKVVTMPKWTKTAPDACTMPLTLVWWDPQFRPIVTGKSYLPSYVQERDVSDIERDHVLTVRPREKTTQSWYRKRKNITRDSTFPLNTSKNER